MRPAVLSGSVPLPGVCAGGAARLQAAVRAAARPGSRSRRPGGAQLHLHASRCGGAHIQRGAQRPGADPQDGEPGGLRSRWAEPAADREAVWGERLWRDVLSRMGQNSGVPAVHQTQLQPSVPERWNVPPASALRLQTWLKGECMRAADGAHTPLPSAGEWTHQRARHWLLKRTHVWTQWGSPPAHTSAGCS